MENVVSIIDDVSSSNGSTALQLFPTTCSLTSKPFLLKTCLTCLRPLTANKTCVDLFSVCEEGQTLADLLKICCDIKISENLYNRTNQHEGMAKSSKAKEICNECATTLLIMYKFRIKAQEAQRILALQELESSANFSSFDQIAGSAADTGPSLPTKMGARASDGTLFVLNESFDINTADLLEPFHMISDLDDSLASSVSVLTPPSSIGPPISSDDGRATAENSCDDEIINYVLPIIKPKNIKVEDVEPQSLRLKRRERRSVKETPINFKCKQCGAGFFMLRNLVNHLKVQHSIQEKYSCHVCSISLTNVDEYLEHAKLHEETLRDVSLQPIKKESNIKNIKIKPSDVSAPKSKLKNMYKCTHCPKTFVSKSSLDAHIRVHTGERPYQCKYCEKLFKTQGALELHERRHAGIKPYVCSYCNKSFVESSNLKVHVRSHTKEKPHICVTCGRGFSRVFLLQIHTRIHTGERPYKCNICQKAFSQRGDLKAHKKIHTNDRPYACTECGKRFIKNSSLNQHKKSHVKLFEDELTDLKETDMVDHLNDDNIMLPMFDSIYFST